MLGQFDWVLEVLRAVAEDSIVHAHAEISAGNVDVGDIASADAFTGDGAEGHDVLLWVDDAGERRATSLLGARCFVGLTNCEG